MSDKEKNNETLVSIIIPVYNVENYIEKCLRSITKQRYPYFEAIVVNDGSTDDTLKICTKFASKDTRFHIVDKRNEGVSAARNLGLLRAQGMYICFVDGDDYLDENYLNVLTRYITSDKKIDLVCTDYFLETDKRITTYSPQMAAPVLLSNKEAIDRLNDKHLYQGYLWNKIFKREIISNNNITFDTRVKIWEDMLFCLKYLTHSNKIFYVRIPLYYYVKRKDSTINNPFIWKEGTHQYALEQMWSIVKNYDGNFKEYIRNFYANFLVGQLCKNEKDSYTDIQRQISKIESLHGILTFKHKFKILLVKIFPSFIIKIYKIK